MKKKVVALVLATAMIVSQFMGAAQSFAAGTTGTQAEEAAGVNDSVESANGGETPPAQAEVKAILKKETDGTHKVYARTDTDEATGSEMTGEQLNTITDLLIDDMVTEVPNNKFNGKANITKLTFENAETNTATITIGEAAFKGISAANVVFPNSLTTIKYSAFEGAGITRVELPDSLTTMEHSAFKNTPSLTKVVVGSNLTAIKGGTFEGTTALTELDLTKATSLATVRENAFKRSGLMDMYIGQNTMVFSNEANQTGNLFTETSSSKEIHFVGSDRVHLGADERTKLETKWIAFKGADKGSWTFFDSKEETPNASANYDEMKLTGLTANAKYKIAVVEPSGANGAAEANVSRNTALTWQDKSADGDGKINIEKAWGGKTIKIMSPATSEKLESDIQDIPITAIYTVTVDTVKERDTIAGKQITLTAAETQADKGFAKWTASEGVNIADLTQLTITFNMPAQDVTLTKVYQPYMDTPAAAANYTDMKLTNLSPNGTYNLKIENTPSSSGATTKATSGANVPVEEAPKTITADGDGKVDIKKEWGGKTLKITALATADKVESKPQSLPIDFIYTIMIDETEKNTKVGTEVSFTAEDRDGYGFVTWEVTGVDISNLTEKQITFNMPSNDVTLKKIYKLNGTKPNAAADYNRMKLTGLTPSAVYKITAQEAPSADTSVAERAEAAAETITADASGEIDIKKEWGGKTLKIASAETETHLESAAQSLAIENIYTVTVNGKEYRNATATTEISVTADNKEGYIFVRWEVAGTTLQDPTAQTINFPMPAENVALTATYTKVVATPPEELVYDGDKEVSVKLDVSRADFKGIRADGKLLEEGKDYIVAEAKGVKATATGGITVTFTKAYLDTLKGGEQDFKIVLTKGEVDFSIKVEEKPAKPAVTYPDVKEGEWFYEAVMYVSSKEIMSGYADGTFGPADKLGRGQFATILYRMAGSPTVEYKNIFSDVPEGQFYSLPAIWAQTNNVITGYADGRFGPSDSITREQLATMLYRYAMMKGTDVSERVDLNKYPDAGKVSVFAKDAMSWVVAKGIIKGDQGNLNPQGDSSRAVVATMIQRFQTGQ